MEHETSLIISIISLIISGIAILAFFLARRTFKAQALTTSFEIISDIDVKKAKKILADEYWRCKESNEVPNFRNHQNETFLVCGRYNQACAMYQRNLVDKKHFREIYDGNIVRTYKILTEHIVAWLPNNPEYCKHFTEVAKELMEEHSVNQEIYRDIDDSSKSSN